MDPILIIAYPEKIAAEQSWLDNQIAYFQTIYNQFKALGVTVSLSEINQVRHGVTSSASSGYLDNLIVDKMIAKAGNPTFNGLPIKKHMLKDLIDIPDVQPIRAWIKNANADIPAILQPELLEIVADVVQRKATTNALIEAKYTQYTKNDKGVQTYNLLMDWRDIVDEFNERLTDLKATFKIPYYGLTKHPDNISRPSLTTVRENEVKYPADYVVE